MDKTEVRIVQLARTRVASAQAFGPSPEGEAWDKLCRWAEPRGILGDRKRWRVFGFNNPDPSPGSPNYGYEFWITIDGEMTGDGDVRIKEFGGGMYAVARCDVQGNAATVIPAAWQNLIRWRETSPYRMGSHQWLEEHLTGPDPAGAQWQMDLYMPIRP